jgi:hypothetical protein
LKFRIFLFNYFAERYARVCYECLNRPIDTESEEIADAAAVLARVSYELISKNGLESGDILEVEMLARKALRIKEKLFGRNSYKIKPLLSTLCSILELKGDYSDECKCLNEESLAIHIRYSGADSDSVRRINVTLSIFHHDIGIKSNVDIRYMLTYIILRYIDIEIYIYVHTYMYIYIYMYM